MTMMPKPQNSLVIGKCSYLFEVDGRKLGANRNALRRKNNRCYDSLWLCSTGQRKDGADQGDALTMKRRRSSARCNLTHSFSESKTIRVTLDKRNGPSHPFMNVDTPANRLAPLAADGFKLLFTGWRHISSISLQNERAHAPLPAGERTETEVKP